MSMNAGRMIIREGDDPHTVIFIVTGEIEMSKADKKNVICLWYLFVIY